MPAYFQSCRRDTRKDARALAAFADGPVADHPEPVTAERGVPFAEPYRADLDSMRHR